MAKYFVSYRRSSDEDFVLALATRLRAAGADIWVDQLDIVVGQAWEEAVETALRNCAGLIVVLSPQSIVSANVKDEISYALGRNKPVIPVLRAPCEIPLRLGRLQHADFTSDYEKGFTVLLRALGVQGAGDAMRSPAAREPIPIPVPTRSAGAIAPGQYILRAALVGAALGAVCGAIYAQYAGFMLTFAAIVMLAYALAGGIAAAIAGNRTPPSMLAVRALGAAAVLGIVFSIFDNEAANGIALVAPAGAILGALGGAIWDRMRQRQ